MRAYAAYLIAALAPFSAGVLIMLENAPLGCVLASLGCISFANALARRRKANDEKKEN